MSGPTVIDRPGCYALAAGTTGSDADVFIEIRSSDVYLDGGGHALSGVSRPNTHGVLVAGEGALTNVTVTNLAVSEWDTGLRFADVAEARVDGVSAASNVEGVVLTRTPGVDVAAADARSNGLTGLALRDSPDARFRAVTAAGNGERGIAVSRSPGLRVTETTAARNAALGIEIGQSPGVALSNVTARHNGRTGILLDESPKAALRDVDSSSNLGGITIRDGDDSVVAGATLNGNADTGLNFPGTVHWTGPFSDNVTVIDTEASENGGTGFRLIGTTRSLLSNNTAVGNGQSAFLFTDSPGNTLLNNTARDNRGTGFLFHTDHRGVGESDYATLRENVAVNNSVGFYTFYSSHLTFEDNVARSNADDGFSLFNGANYTLVNNTAIDNDGEGLQLNNIRRSVLRRNDISGSEFDFLITGGYDDDTLDNDIDTSNTVEGRPIYYLRDPVGVTIDSDTDAGAVFVIGGRDVVVRDLNLSGNSHGVFLWRTRDARIENVTANANLEAGFALRHSPNATLRNNLALGVRHADPTGEDYNGDYGFNVRESPDATIVDNAALGADSSGFFVDADRATVRGNLARSNTRRGFTVFGANATVVDNVADSNGRSGFTLQQRAGFYLDLDGGSVVNNTAVDNADDDAPELSSGNRAQRSIDRGFWVDGGSIAVSGNAAAGHDVGLTLVADDSALRGNDLSANLVGLWLLERADSAVADGNWLADNDRYGLLLGADSALVANNTIAGNRITGLYVDGGADNLVYNNVFDNADDVGFSSESSPPANAWNVTPTAGRNVIDGPILGGNYWASPAGTGFSERSADDDGDGLADFEHRLAPDNVDGAPLTVVTAPAIAVAPPTHDYGELVVGDDASRTFALANAGTENLTVTDVAVTGTDAGEFALSGWNGTAVVSPGDAAAVAVAFAPATPGAKNATLRIESDDPARPVVDVPLNGTAIAETPDVGVSPAAVDFGNVTVGASASATLTVTNEGTGNLSVADVRLTGRDAATFTIARENASGVAEPGAVREVVATFDPDAIGPAEASLIVESDDPDEAIVAVSLSGNGTTALEPAVRLEPPARDFGDVRVGDSASATVSIENVGTADLTVSNVSIGGSGSDQFAAQVATPFALAPGENRTVAVTFAPTAEGDARAALLVESDDPDASVVEGSLLGTGIAPDVSVSPADVDFGEVVVGDSATLVVSVSNAGDATLHVAGSAITGSDADAFGVADVGSFALAPGESRDLAVTFAPVTAGVHDATLVVRSDDPDDPAATVSLDGRATSPDDGDGGDGDDDGDGGDGDDGRDGDGGDDGGDGDDGDGDRGIRIDVKQTINPRAGGVIPVEVLATDDFDPSTLDVTSLRFGDPEDVDAGDGAAPAHDGHLRGNGDLLLHFPAADAGFDGDETEGKLVGETAAGDRVIGTDGVRIAGRGTGTAGGGSGDADRSNGNAANGNGRGRLIDVWSGVDELLFGGRFFSLRAPSPPAFGASGSVGGETAPAAISGARAVPTATAVDACAVIDAPGRYRLNGSAADAESACVAIRSSDVHLDGGGHRLDGADRADSVGVLVDGIDGRLDNVTVTGLSVTDWDRGVRVVGATNVTIEAVEAVSNEVGVEFDAVADATVADASVRRNDRGMLARASANVTVRGSGVLANGGDGVAFEGTNASAVVGNAVGRNGHGGYSTAAVRAECTDCEVRDVRVLDNDVYHSFLLGDGVSISGEGHLVAGNRVWATDVAVAIDGRNGTVRDNAVSDGGEGVGVGGADHLIENNTVHSVRRGIRAEGLEGGRVADNRVTNLEPRLNLQYGIGLVDSRGTVVEGNDASDLREEHSSPAVGLLLSGTDGAAVIGNEFSRNGRAGIVLTDGDRGASGNVIADNAVADNGHYGVRLFTDEPIGSTDSWAYVRNTTLTNNTVTGHTVGLEFASTTRNVMRGNELTDNRFNFYVRQHGYPEDDPDASRVEHFLHDVDPSNTVDGRPIHYRIGDSGTTLGADSDAGFVAFVNSEGVAVEDLSFRNNSHGVLLVNTTDSLVRNVSTRNVAAGVALLEGADRNEVVGANVTFHRARYGGTPMASGEEANAVLVGRSAGNRIVDAELRGARYAATRGVAVWHGGDDTLLANSTATAFAPAVQFRGAEGGEVRDTEIRSTGHGIALYDVSRTTLSANAIDVRSGHDGVRLGGTLADVSVRDNRITGGEHAIQGRYIDGTDVRLVGNRLARARYGVDLYRSSGVTIGRNEIEYNHVGVNVAGTRNVVSDNALVGNDGGVRLDGDSAGTDENVVRGNDVRRSFRYGIALEASYRPLRNNTVVGNEIVGTRSPDSEIDYALGVSGSGATGNVLADNVVRDTDGDALAFTDRATGNRATNLTVSNVTGWAAVSELDAAGNAVEDLRIDGARLSAEMLNAGLAAAESPGGEPVNYRAVGPAFRSEAVETSWTRPPHLALDVGYEDADLADANESTLRLWRYVGGSTPWEPVVAADGDTTSDPADASNAPSQVVNETANVVSANLTRFGAPPIYAPLALSLNATNATPTFASAPAGADWAEYGRDPADTSAQPLGAGPLANATERWSAPVGGDVPPAVVGDTVYAVRGTTLYALDADTGAVDWETDFDSDLSKLTSSPAVRDGVVYVAGRGDRTWIDVYAIDARTGHRIWSHTRGTRYYGDAHHLTVADGTVYAATGPSTGSNVVLALDADAGDERWAADVGGRVRTPPVVVGGAVIASTGYSTTVLNASTGAAAVTLPAARGRDLAYAEDTLFVATTDGVSAYDLPASLADGSAVERWTTTAPGYGGVYSLATADGVVVAGEYDGNVSAYDVRNGSVRWRYADAVRSGAYPRGFAIAGGHVYAPRPAENAVAALDLRDGRVAARYDLGAEPLAPVAANCALYTALDDGRLIALVGDARCGPDIAVTPERVDFGAVSAGEAAAGSVTATNVGVGTLSIDRVSVDGANATAFALTDGGSFALAPGESRSIGVSFAPATPGEKSATLRIESDDPDVPAANVSLTGVRNASVALAVDGPLDSLSPGDAVAVDVAVDTQGLDAYAAQATVRFDPEVFAVNESGVSPGTLLSQDANATLVIISAADGANGTIEYAETRTGPLPIDGSGTLLRVSFDVVADAPAGTSELALADAVVSDENAAGVPVSVTNGTAVVTGGNATNGTATAMGLSSAPALGATGGGGEVIR